jgi:teichuronic acid exporter
LTKDDRQRSLDVSVAGGVAWTAGAKWATQLFSWAALAITARLLAPSDYGIGEEAGYFFALTNTLAEFGVGTAALHLNELDDEALHQLH